MKYFFPLHFDGNNRGCEGIAKGTALVLGEPKENLIAYSKNVVLDTFLGIDKYMTLQECIPMTLKDKIKRAMENSLSFGRHKTDNYFKYEYSKFLKQIGINDIMISTGGDMLCYGNNMVNTTNNFLHTRGVKTILWGCSMGKENYTKEKYETLKNFTFIYTRETLTYNYFKNLGLKNVVCLPDPAFVLQPEKITLPTCFQDSDVIGINISPFIIKGGDLSSPFGHEVKKIIDFILTHTKLSILLIPHVFWNGQDDKIVASNIASIFENPERIFILDSEKLSYTQIRFVISKCKFFIGGRTHAVISAYSTCVPTIALGYSIKSKGIAKDLGLDNMLIVDTTSEYKKNGLLESFNFCLENEVDIRKHLESIMPEYKKKPYQINQHLLNL